MERSMLILKDIKENILTKIPSESRNDLDEDIRAIEEKINLHLGVFHCHSCELRKTCKQPTSGIGPIPSDIMFVGEAPGEEEDLKGAPFVGPAGQLLTRAIESVGWNRNDFYITNVVKCRPPYNRTPSLDEASVCYQHLKKEIELVKPKVIICLGSVAANFLIHPDFKITKENGQWFEKDGIRYIAVYHPSYLLRLGDRTEQQKKAKWEVYHAFQKVKQFQESGFASSDSL